MCLHSIDLLTDPPPSALVYKGFSIYCRDHMYIINPWLKGWQQYTTSKQVYKPDVIKPLVASNGDAYMSGFHGYLVSGNMSNVMYRILYSVETVVVFKCEFTDITTVGTESGITALVAQSMQLRQLAHAPYWVDQHQLAKQLDLENKSRLLGVI